MDGSFKDAHGKQAQLDIEKSGRAAANERTQAAAEKRRAAREAI
jgi:hypothetical protein